MVSPGRLHPAPHAPQAVACCCRLGCGRGFQGCRLLRSRLRRREQVLRLAFPVPRLVLPMVTLLPHVRKRFAQERNHYREKVSGAKANRAELMKVVNKLEPGDVLVVTRLDRLAHHYFGSLLIPPKLLFG